MKFVFHDRLSSILLAVRELYFYLPSSSNCHLLVNKVIPLVAILVESVDRVTILHYSIFFYWADYARYFFLKDSANFRRWKMTFKLRILRSLTRLFIILVSLMRSLFSEKMLVSNRCISGLMSNLIKKSWKVSSHDVTKSK